MKNLLFVFIVLLGFTSYAQDIITTKKGEDIKAKVLEINIHEVKYKKVENPDSPIYTLLKSDILMIRYENGSKDIFNEESKETAKAEGNRETLSKNRISIVEGDHFLNGEPISGGEMKSILFQDSEAKEIYKSSQRIRTGSTLFAIGSIICSTASIILSIDNLSRAEKVTDEELNRPLYPLIPAVALCIPSLILRKVANRRKAEAIETYNRNQEKKVSIIPTIGAGSAGLVIRF
jgi:hypothetical protein